MSEKPPAYPGDQYPPGQQYPPPGQQYPPTGQQYAPPGQQYPPPGQQYPQGGYPQPQQGYAPAPGQAYPGSPASASTVVVTQTPAAVIVTGNCPSCRVGNLREEYNICGIILAILFFPLGIICCLMMTEKRCSHCGRHF